MSAAFTPGPWYAGQSQHQRTDHPGQRTVALSLDPDGTPFGFRLGVDNDDGAYLNLSGFCSEADGRLIAAAPDLYEAVTALRHHLSGAPKPSTLLALLANADIAIAKAEGRP